MSAKKKPAFILVHGAWHGAATWDHLIPLLEARGHVVRAFDLPGAGAHAKAPVAYEKRPFDPTAFAMETSPNAAVTQEERTNAVISLIDELGGDVVLVGHSLGGLTISAVAEAVPDRLHVIVYLSGFLLPPGISAMTMMQHETLAASLVPPLFLADPAVGALRVNPRTDDAKYRADVKSAFYADLTDADFERALSSLHCDEPAGVCIEASSVSRARFGSVERHYIRCLADKAIPIAGQDLMIAKTDEAVGGKTSTHTLNSSHSAFYSQPQTLADVLASVVMTKK